MLHTNREPAMPLPACDRVLQTETLTSFAIEIDNETRFICCSHADVAIYLDTIFNSSISAIKRYDATPGRYLLLILYSTIRPAGYALI